MKTYISLPYVVVRTQFHASDGSGASPYGPSRLDRAVISMHRTLDAAERAAARKRRDTDCTCGCYLATPTTWTDCGLVYRYEMRRS